MRYPLTALLLCCLFSFQSKAIDSIAALCQAVRTARPGDTLVLKNGEYANAEIILTGNGTAERPIVVKAETPGGVIISGGSALRISGTGIEVNGFRFTNGYAPKGAVWEFRSGTEAASDCRITQCVIDHFDPPSRETEYSWVLLYGRRNRFDHNTLEGKLNQGVTLAVILDEARDVENGHRIEYNHFYKRPYLGANGGETIRVGTSQSSLLSSRTIIQNNFFEQCDGEVEVVSIKSCDNIIRNNTFLESAGVLALRHGHRNLVEGNAFIGNGKPHTGGIRVINEGHRIRNNFFYRLAGDRFYAALAIMNAVPNSLPNRYHQVKDVEIADNVWVDCDNIQFCVGRDNERTLPPANVRMENNIFYNPRRNTVFTAFDRIDGFVFSGNRVVTSGAFRFAGFTESKQLDPSRYYRMPVERQSCGASWYASQPAPARQLSGNLVPVKAGQNTLSAAVAAAAHGDVIELTEAGEYRIDNPVGISRYLRIQKAPGLAARPVIRYNGAKGKAAVFTIQDGGLLELQGLAFDNNALPGKAAATASVAPAAQMRGHYSAFIDDCEFYNFTEGSTSPFRAQRTTLADSLVFTRCLFRDLSGEAIYLSAEKDDAGKYSAENVVISNCAFYKVLGYACDLYRGGSDESTTGPSIVIRNCVLEDVNNKERGAGFRLFGAQNVLVENTSFANTGRGGAAIRFDENSWDNITVRNCNLYASGKVLSFWGRVVKGPLYNLAPAYRSFNARDFRIKPGTVLAEKKIGLSTTTN